MSNIIKHNIFLPLLILLILINVTGCGKGNKVTVYQSSTATDKNRSESQESNMKSTKETGNNSNEDDTIQDEVYVQICGAVNQPGVYKVKNSLRVFEAIKIAGGVTEEGATDELNLAANVSDEMKIYVPTKTEVQNGSFEMHSYSNTKEEEKNSEKININAANLETLMQLPGIGEAKANAIIAYREQNGKFSCIEDIMNISGIKESAFNKIKELIIV